MLADSNLDWGQGLKAIARLQDGRPELKDLTLYYFGDEHTADYRVAGKRHVRCGGVASRPARAVRGVDGVRRRLSIASARTMGPGGLLCAA